MAMSAEHRSKFAVHWYWWRFHMSEKFWSGTINLKTLKSQLFQEIWYIKIIKRCFDNRMTTFDVLSFSLCSVVPSPSLFLSRLFLSLLSILSFHLFACLHYCCTISDKENRYHSTDKGNPKGSNSERARSRVISTC